MKKVLILEPFYSSFHVELASYLSKGGVSALIFNLGNLVYLKGVKKIYAHRRIIKKTYSEKDIVIVSNCQNLYSHKVKLESNTGVPEESTEYMAKFVAFFREYLSENDIDIVLMHSDLRWQHALAIKVCRELKVKYLVTERGLFRPDTLTVDFEGVNEFNSLPRKKDFYFKNQPDIKESLNNYRVPALIKLSTNLKFFVFIFLNYMGDILSINSYLKNKSFKFFSYFRLLFSQLNLIKSDQFIPNKFVFIPLQVNTDTQLLVHSDYDSVQEFIKQVEAVFYESDSDLKLVFKLHPMEKNILYHFDERSVVSSASTKDLIDRCEFLITINSTVGFEALASYKKVIVLGRAFFKIRGITVCSDQVSFASDFKKVVLGDIHIDELAIDAFLNYVKYEYQINGNLYYWSDETLKNILNKIDKVGRVK